MMLIVDRSTGELIERIDHSKKSSLNERKRGLIKCYLSAVEKAIALASADRSSERIFTSPKDWYSRFGAVVKVGNMPGVYQYEVRPVPIIAQLGILMSGKEHCLLVVPYSIPDFMEIEPENYRWRSKGYDWIPIGRYDKDALCNNNPAIGVFEIDDRDQQELYLSLIQETNRSLRACL